jgi:hypothetical protein
MTAMTFERQGNWSEDAECPGAWFGRMVRIGCLTLRANADEFALGNKPLTNGRIDIAEHGESLPSRCQSRFTKIILADLTVIKVY